MKAGGDIDGGLDTARVPHLPAAEQARRDRQRAKARANLAAVCCDWYGVVPGRRNAPAAVQLAAREFAEMSAALGLDAQEHAPGRCRRCSAPLPMSNATTAGGTRHEVLCHPCRKAAQ